MNRKIIILLLSLILSFVSSVAFGDSFVAFSLKEAQKQLSQGKVRSQVLLTMGGITRPFCVVYDKSNEDLLVVGAVVKGESPISLDDFVVALRALFTYKAWPLVSIDKTTESLKVDSQLVRFAGGIENTRFGLSLLQADVVLKELALGLKTAKVWGIKSYFDLYQDYWKQSGKEEVVESRFWFTPSDPVFASREGIALIQDMRIIVSTQLMASQDPTLQNKDVVGDQFSSILSKNYLEISNYYPEVKKLNALFRLVGLSLGIQRFSQSTGFLQNILNFWLSNYKVSSINTPKHYPLIKKETTLKNDTRSINMSLDGGVELKVLLSDLKDGSVLALKDIVIKSRQNFPAGSLTWRIPLFDWHIPGYPIIDAGNDNNISKSYKFGMYLSSSFSSVNSSQLKQRPSFTNNASSFNSPSFKNDNYKVTINNYTQPQTFSNVGGVMLSGVAEIEGSPADLNLSSGNFSFVLNGESAFLDPNVFRKFVTAAWSVYYCDQSPGISIDPIAPGVNQHLVRYIGNVLNNDLGRVMRETDYKMKKWAVGTERPAGVPGFESVDDISATTGIDYIGASRRFWFVPEDMQFKKSDNVLLYDKGRMTLKTEYMVQDKGERAAPSDERFANFFTDNYELISRQYPIYEELFEYAKMVSLLQYLKQNGVPMQWFLMAHKDYVITEDAPGTVKELVKGSTHFPGVEIHGGVDLKTQPGQYKYDVTAIKAINDAMSKFVNNSTSNTSLGNNSKPAISESFSFDLENKAFTVLPQHSQTSAVDRKGIRYQTDIAMHNGSESGLELVRFYNPAQNSSAEFGNGWHLLIPYRLKPANKETITFQNLKLPKQMALVNLINSQTEILTFNTTQYSVVGYVPNSLQNSQLIGIFLMSDGSFRMEDKIGNSFRFDGAGYLTDMFLGLKGGNDYHSHITFEYNDGLVKNFETAYYHLRKIDTGTTNILNVLLPTRLQIENNVNNTKETIVFLERDGISAYYPENGDSSTYDKMVLMTDASYRLIDTSGNEISFGPAGEFNGFFTKDNANRTVSLITQGDYMVKFGYSLGKSHNLLIGKAYLINKINNDKPLYVVDYSYDNEERLAKAEGLDPKNQ